MTLILIAPGIEKKLSDINDTLKSILSVMDDDFSGEDAAVKAMFKFVEEAKERIPTPETPTTNKGE